jgi:hypothetical protein
MGWWDSENGNGVIGDRPVDIAERVLTDAFGERFDSDLFAGFLGSVGAALARTPETLLADAFDREHAAFVIEYAERSPQLVPVRPPLIQTALDDAVYAALRDIASEYRASELGRPPFLAEVLETIAFAARVHLVAAEDGDAVTLIRVRDQRMDKPGPDASVSDLAMRRLLAAEPPLPRAAIPLVAQALADPSWETRMRAVLVAGRFGLAELAGRVRAVDVPPAGHGLDDEDRRALLALRDAAAARAEGRLLERPVHPDPDIAARRSTLLAAVEAAIAGDSPIDHESVLARLAYGGS